MTETSDPTSRTRVTSTRYERVTTTGTQVVEREWIIHWHTPSSFHRLCRETGLDIVDLFDDDTGSAAGDQLDGVHRHRLPKVRPLIASH